MTFIHCLKLLYIYNPPLSTFKSIDMHQYKIRPRSGGISSVCGTYDQCCWLESDSSCQFYWLGIRLKKKLLAYNTFKHEIYWMLFLKLVLLFILTSLLWLQPVISWRWRGFSHEQNWLYSLLVKIRIGEKICNYLHRCTHKNGTKYKKKFQHYAELQRTCLCQLSLWMKHIIEEICFLQLD